MKIMKRILATLLAAIIVAGVFAPAATEAATKPTVSFYGWAKEDQTSCYLKVKNGGSDGYYYRIYVNGKLYKSNGKSVLADRSICRVYGIPKKTIVTISVRGVKQSTWSSRIVVAPVMMENTHFKISFPANSKKVKFSWSKITGATDYAIYMSTSPSTGWTKVGSTTGTSMTISKFNGKAFTNYTNYYYKIVCRKKVGGKYYGSKVPSASWYAGYFYFRVIYK